MSENILSKQFNKTDSTNCGIVDLERISPLWSQLPAPALELLYSYLSLKDRYNMSLVCRKWSKEFKSPSVWKHFEINFQTKGMWEKYFSGDQFVHRFVQFFRHVRIVCGFNMSQLKLFLKVITPRCQLFSIHLKEILVLGHKANDFDVEYLQCILSFFESQSNLKEITFDYCFFFRKVWHQIFASIAKHSTSLKKIIFFQTEHQILSGLKTDFIAEKRQIFEFFMTLTEMEMDGNFFEQMIIDCSDMEPALSPLKSKSLKSIKLYFTYRYKLLGIDIQSFRKALNNFRKQLPRLKIDVLFIGLDVEEIQAISELHDMKNMGIRSLQIKHFFDCYDLSSIIKSLIFLENVELLEICRLKTTNNVVQDLISLLQTCPNLKELILESKDFILGIDIVFIFLIKSYRGNLSRFCLVMDCGKSLADGDTFYKMQQEYIYKMQQEYSPKLREIGIYLKMSL